MGNTQEEQREGGEMTSVLDMLSLWCLLDIQIWKCLEGRNKGLKVRYKRKLESKI